MTTVTDTSVVLNLCCLRQETLINRLFGSIFAPPAVVREFQRLSRFDSRFHGLTFPEFIQIETPSKVPASLAGNRKLHVGEIDALSLAIEKKADVVLMDEQAGRITAEGMGLRCIGILGILIQAKSEGLLPELSPLLDCLESQAGFWIAPTLRQRVLGLARE